MTENQASKSKLNPVALVAVGIILLVAVVFGISRMGNSAGEDGASEGSARAGSKGAARYEDDGSGGSRHGGKSADKTEAERIAGRPYVLLADDQDIKQKLVKVSVEARNELKELRAKSKTKFDDPEERREFGELLSKVTDPRERQTMLRDRTAAMKEARAKAEALKPSVDIARERQLIALMQVQNLWRMATFVGKNPELNAEATDFANELVAWVEKSGEYDNETFHSSFDELRTQLAHLRQRDSKSRPPSAARRAISPLKEAAAEEEYSPE